MRTRMPFASALPIAALLFASLTASEASAGPKPPEPAHKPKPPETPAPTPPASAPPPATSAAEHGASAAAHAASAAPTPSGSAAAPAGSGGPPGLALGLGKGTPPGLGVGPRESRLAALTKLIEERKASAEARRKTEQDQTRVRWGAVVEQPAVAAELKTHAQRVARLGRIQELADVEGKPALAARAARAVAAENARHEKQMQTLAGGAK